MKKATKIQKTSRKTTKNFFRLKNNYTGEKEFSLALRKLDGSPTKLFSKEISIEFLIKPRQNGRKKMYDKLSVVDAFMVLGIQDLTQLTTLNPMFIDISNPLLCRSFVDKYSPEKFMYRSRLTGVTISMDVDILVTCTGLKDCKKADINRTIEHILAIIHTKNIVNWAHWKNTSNWINIDLVG